MVFPTKLAEKAANPTLLLLAGRELLLVIALRLALACWTTLVVSVTGASVSASRACTSVKLGVETAGVGFIVFRALLGSAVGVVGA